MFKALLHLDLFLTIICSFPDQLKLMLVCPTSKPGAVVQGMRAGARLQPALLEVEAAAGATESEGHCSVSMRTFL